MLLERGALLNNRYRIVEILGQGGMGSVYRAVDENLGVDVAVKDNLFTTDDYARQFRREAVILANLRHPNLPRVTDHFVIDGQGQYLVMDYIDGEDLRQRMDRLGLLSEDDVITIGAAICEALTYLSTRNPAIVHRDIKPGNVKITPQGQIYLVDFGLAKILMSGQATTTGARAMTPGYSPPEQYGTARTDHRSDVFSLGATLYAALTGSIPEDALARAMGQADLTPIREHNPKVSRRLAAAIEKALEVQPDDRFQTAEEFKQALLAARSASRRRNGEYLVSPPPEVPDPPPPVERIPPPPEQILEAAPEKSPAPIFLVSPVEEPQPKARKRRKESRVSRLLRGCVIVILSALLIVGVSSLAVYFYAPNLPSQVIALAGMLRTATAEPTNAAPAPTHTETPAVQASPTVMPAITSPTDDPLAFPTRVNPQATRSTPTVTPTPSPTPHGGGSGELAFASDVSGVIQIYVADIEGGPWQQVTDLPEGACQPDWSPDGQQLVFISPCKDNYESYPGAALFTINVDGSGMMPIPSVPGGDYDPAWSPDGKRIAFTSIRNKGRPQIFVYDLETKTTTQLSEGDNRDLQPAWSADGRLIVFVSTRRGPSQLWTMNANGSNQRLFSASRDKINSSPDWSPDGQTVLFNQIARKGDIPQLYAATLSDVNDYREYPLIADQIPMREGRYSPDGYWIAFESWPGGSNHDIFGVLSNGTGRRELIASPLSFEFDAVWRPPVE